MGQASWGLGIKHLYHAYVSLKQDSMAKVRDWLLGHYGLWGSAPLLSDQEADALGVLLPGYAERRALAGAPLKAVYIDRAPKPGSNRHFADYGPILRAFEQRGVAVTVVKDFGGSVASQLREYVGVDIMIGLHGAGLTNAMFARKGEAGGPASKPRGRQAHREGVRHHRATHGLSQPGSRKETGC